MQGFIGFSQITLHMIQPAGTPCYPENPLQPVIMAWGVHFFGEENPPGVGLKNYYQKTHQKIPDVVLLEASFRLLLIYAGRRCWFRKQIFLDLGPLPVKSGLLPSGLRIYEPPGQTQQRREERNPAAGLWNGQRRRKPHFFRESLPT